MRDRKLTLRARAMRREPTVAERELWELIRARRLHGWKFRRQFAVAGYVVDFACLPLRLAVEIDGPMHDDPEQAAFDLHRDKEIEAAGFVVLRLDEAMVRTAPGQALMLIQHVGRQIAERRAPFPGDEYVGAEHA